MIETRFRMKMNKIAMWAVLGLLALGAALPGAAMAASGAQGTVVVPALNVRQGPGTSYTVIDVAHAGDVLAVTGVNKAAGWYQVGLAAGRSGWVSGALVKVTGDAAAIPEVAAPGVPAGTGASAPDRSAGGASRGTGAEPGARAMPAASARQSGGRTLVFQVSSGGPIYVADVDAAGSTASNLRYLTNGMDPALSPDGKWVAFTRWEGAANGVEGSLWVINVDGSGLRQVTGGANQAKSPTWSADGTQVIISVQQGGNPNWLCSTDDGTVSAPSPLAGVRCTPPDPHWGLREVNVATGEYQDLARERYSFAPSWDPANGWRVLFRGERGLYFLDLNQKTTWLMKESGTQRGPVFSPDGAKIATTFKQNDHWEVHTLNADGQGEVRLTETPQTLLIQQMLQNQDPLQWNNAAPAWSRDGSQIAFITDRNGSYEIWAMNADGSNQHPLLTQAALGALNIHYEGVDERVISWQ